MIKDELDAIETYMRELEALRNYPQVKAERDSLATKTSELEEQVRQLAAQLTSEAYTRQKTASQLKKREAEVRNVTCKLGDAQQELSALHDFQAKLPEGEVTLKKLQERFLRAQTKEIESRARKRVKELSEVSNTTNIDPLDGVFTTIIDPPNHGL